MSANDDPKSTLSSSPSPSPSPLSPANTEDVDPLELYDEIDELRQQQHATILAHYYQQGEIQDLADHTGDSLQLARLATTVETDTIVFCGVHFMAETAKILNPEKRVLLPDLLAGCSLADSCPASGLEKRQQELRAQGRQFQTVTYINSTAAVKSLCDWVVTSGNAVEVIKRIPESSEVLFVPDQHLGRFLEEVTGRPMILWEGSCVVHEMFSISDLLVLKRRMPKAITIAHPECPANIREHSDYVGGTQGMLKYCQQLEEPHDILVATEQNMLWQLQHKSPQHRYHPVPGVTCACNQCPFMARNTLVALRNCLKSGQPEIEWRPEYDRAREVLQRSLL